MRGSCRTQEGNQAPHEGRPAVQEAAGRQPAGWRVTLHLPMGPRSVRGDLGLT
ncbi:hypothetical protein BC826DRAFT_990042 [Russula brevipes]|nr:hypothetical protein BC826DRAFT_990042 [Russula brevipes]